MHKKTQNFSTSILHEYTRVGITNDLAVLGNVCKSASMCVRHVCIRFVLINNAKTLIKLCIFYAII